MAAWILCTLLLAAPQGAAEQAPPPFPWTIPAYLAELDRLAAALAGATPEQADRISVRVPPQWRVTTAAGDVDVDLRWLVTELRQAPLAGAAWPQRRAAVTRRLAALRDHGTRASGAGGSAALRAAVTRVLAEGEFAHVGRTTWRERLQKRVGEWVQSILRSVGAPRLGGRTVAVVLAWLAAGAAALGLTVGLLRAIVKRRSAARLELRLVRGGRTPAREWAVRAAHALASGDLREGIRLGYSAALRAMEEEGAWRMDESRTPREYLRLLREGDSRGDAVRSVTRLFEHAFYGDRPATAADAEIVRQALIRLGCLHSSERAI